VTATEGVRRGRPRQTEPSERHRARRDEIIDTAIRVFHANGYESGSIDDVASSLDLRKGAIYHYFPSKAHLLFSIFDRAITTALVRLEEFDRIADPVERLTALIRHQATIVAREPDLFTVFFDQPRFQTLDLPHLQGPVSLPLGTAMPNSSAAICATF